MFYLNPQSKYKKTYEDLICDLNHKKFYSKYVYKSNTYEIFLDIIFAIIYGTEITLLDSDFSRKELETLSINSNKLNIKETLLKKITILSSEHLIKLMQHNNEKARITLFTSGTTGKPKKVKHTLKSLTRNTKRDSKFKNNIWGFAYNPTHFAGLQVFFQAIYNLNPIIDLFGISAPSIFNILQSEKITHISATPTFFRIIISQMDKPVQTLVSITSGGEKIDKYLLQSLNKFFPNARIKNIYASTEAGSLFASKDEYFKIKDHLKYKIKVSNDGELLIHKNLLGEFENTTEKIIWYNTGDLVEKIGENKFRFISRKTEMINVGGYKVNPHEVEAVIKLIPEIIDARVYAKKSRIIGNVLIADVVLRDKDKVNLQNIEILIHDFLSEKLQRFKIPRVINFKESLKITRSGKKERK